MYAVAIDGPSSSGKSTVAKEVAKKLNVLHLNTGALYRAIGLYAFRNGLTQVDNNNNVIVVAQEIKQIIDNVSITVEFIDGKQHTILNGEDVTELLHTPTISDYSSRVSAIPEIRSHILSLQREIANSNNIVMEGRDITSHVLPNAKYKFFITASAEERATRRYKENLSKGIECKYEDILQDLKQRDYRDEHREVCPLVRTEDSIFIDTSKLTISEAVDKVLSHIKE